MKSNTDCTQERKSRNAARLEEDKLCAVTGGTGIPDNIGKVGDLTSIGQNTDIETLMMNLQHERADQTEIQLRQQMNQIYERNDLLKVANSMLSEARENQSTAIKENRATSMSDEMIAFYNTHNINYDHTGNDKLHNNEEWEINIDNLSGFIDQLNSSSQMDMLRLQSMSTKRNEAYEMMDNMVDNMSNANDSIIENMR